MLSSFWISNNVYRSIEMDFKMIKYSLKRHIFKRLRKKRREMMLRKPPTVTKMIIGKALVIIIGKAYSID